MYVSIRACVCTYVVGGCVLVVSGFTCMCMRAWAHPHVQPL